MQETTYLHLKTIMVDIYYVPFHLIVVGRLCGADLGPVI